MFAFGGAGEPHPYVGEHGGDLAAARRLFPDAAEPFVDLSTGINPNPYPLPRLPAEIFAHLPDSAALERLAATAATAYGAPSGACVAPAPGSQILLPRVCGLIQPGRAAILAPTYSEHARAAALAGHAVAEIGGLGAIGDADLVIVTNPNNPDGRLFAKADLLGVAKTLKARGGLLVLDEAFMDVAPRGASLAPDIEVGNVVVLRSFGKFFGLAGLRLGFALAALPLVARLSAQLGPWAVSGPALTVGATALADRDWIENTRRRLVAAAVRLDAILKDTGLNIVGGATLFRLTRTPAAKALFQHLGSAGILTRTFSDHDEWLRFGLPGPEADWQRLQIAMAEFRDTH
jgi:cobalamin biosynthesis protein CobC